MKKQKTKNAQFGSFLKHVKNIKEVFTAKQQQIDDTPPELYLKRIKEMIELLGSDFEVQEGKLGFLGDCMPEDIAEDWILLDISGMATVLLNNEI